MTSSLHISSAIPSSYDEQGFQELKWEEIGTVVEVDCAGEEEPVRFISERCLLEVIKEMVELNNISRTMNSNLHSDYLEGSSSALKALAVEIGLCEWEDFKD